MNFDNDIPTISSFKELMNEIAWSWNHPEYEIIKTEDGYNLNKLYIEPDCVSYKTDNWYLAPGVYEQFERFVEFIETTEGPNEVLHIVE